MATTYAMPAGTQSEEAVDLLAVVVADSLAPAAVVTTKGDLLTHNASVPARLPVGTDAYVLIADSGQATGLRWGTFPAPALVSPSVDNTVVRFDGTAGAQQTSTLTISDVSGSTTTLSTTAGHLTITSTTGTVSLVATGTLNLNSTSTGGTQLGNTTTATAIRGLTVDLPATSAQLRFGTGTRTTLSAPTPVGNQTATIPDSGGNADFVMTAGAQTIGGAKTFSAAIVGDLTGTADEADKLATARTINGVPFDGTANIAIPYAGTIAVADSSTNGQFRVPFADPGTGAAFMFSNAGLTFNPSVGILAVEGLISLTASSNQIIFGDPDDQPVTISVFQGGVPCTISIPGPSFTAADFVLTEGAQTINGATTFSATVTADITGNAGTVTVANSTTNASYQLAFVNPATGSAAVLSNASFAVNPSTGTLTATIFSGTLVGPASSADTISVADTTGSASPLYLTLAGAVDDIGVAISGDTGLTWTSNPGNFAVTGSVTATSFVGAAAAGSLSGSTLAAGVTASSLTSVGTLVNLAVSNVLSLTDSANQIVFGDPGDQPVTLSVVQGGVPCTISIPGPSFAAADIVLTEGTQTINGAKTFGSTISGNINGVAAQADSVYITPIPGAYTSGVLLASTNEDYGPAWVSAQLSWDEDTQTLFTQNMTVNGNLNATASNAATIQMHDISGLGARYLTMVATTDDSAAELDADTAVYWTGSNTTLTVSGNVAATLLDSTLGAGGFSFTTNQDISTSTYTALTGAITSLNANTTCFTANSPTNGAIKVIVAGRYVVHWCQTWDFGAGTVPATFLCYLDVNGSQKATHECLNVATQTHGTPYIEMQDLAVNDVLKFYVYQTAGTAKANYTSSANFGTRIHIWRV